MGAYTFEIHGPCGCILDLIRDNPQVNIDTDATCTTIRVSHRSVALAIAQVLVTEDVEFEYKAIS